MQLLGLFRKLEAAVDNRSQMGCRRFLTGATGSKRDVEFPCGAAGCARYLRCAIRFEACRFGSPCLQARSARNQISNSSRGNFVNGSPPVSVTRKVSLIT